MPAASADASRAFSVAATAGVRIGEVRRIRVPRWATVASGGNAPVERPSVGAATADRRSAQPGSTAMVAGGAGA
jgi:hypothetical protein